MLLKVICIVLLLTQELNQILLLNSKNFGFEVDFQRDIRKGDWFEILYEKFEDDNNKVRDTGKIIYASMYVNGEEINLYNFKFNKQEDYYDIKGKSITKSLMKTPINGARLSSSFGMRKHLFWDTTKCIEELISLHQVGPNNGLWFWYHNES